jgi:aspartyl-tRNA(Asn)/glutamyl-tRNA(Gln) amidotransferase subunit A
MSTPPPDMTAAALLDDYRAGRSTPTEAVRGCLERIATLDPVLNAFCLTDPAGALAAAEASDARWARGEPAGKLDGVPVSIKDLFLTKGWPTLCGSKAVDPHQPWSEDAPAVARLREAGAILLGKTTTSEFGHKGVGDNPLTGITRNPWNTALTTGGSSAGAGAAAAAGFAPMNLGSDGGGSIRIPAAFCGVVGFKPGFGTVPSFGAITGPLVADGPLTRTVRDAALMLDVIASPDLRDPTPAAMGSHDLLGTLDAGVAGLRIGYLPTISGAPVDPEVAAAVRRGADLLAAAGARVEEITLDLPDAVDAYYTILSAGTAMLLDGFDASRQSLMETALHTLANMGRKVSGVAYAQAYHRTRAGFIKTMRALYARLDLVVLPTMPCTAFPVMQDYPGVQDGRWRADWTPFTFPFNLTSQPACSVPCGLSAAGLPIGLQLLGPWGAEARVLRAAQALETASGGFPVPPVPSEA